MTSQGKPHVLLGVTGCIAAYKAAELLRELQRRGAEVRVVMTAHGAEFVGPATFRALTDAPVGLDTFGDPSDAIPHIRLAEWADAFAIAPCTANVAAKLACGIADDLLTTTALACTAPLVLAPAMNVRMYESPATQANLATLRERGAHVLEADDGYQACGDSGPGRMPEPAAVADAVMALLAGAPAANSSSGEALGSLAGRRVLVTAGPTVEPIDAVRFLSNHSSGKMGYAVAAEAARRGAEVTLVSGPVALEAPTGCRRVQVGTAREMAAAATEVFSDVDLAVLTAAVADFRPAQEASRKLKKGVDDERLRAIELVENPDILAACASAKRPGQVVVGFAAETHDLLAHARAKLEAKGADLIVANLVGHGRGFGADENQAVLVTAEGAEELPMMPKAQLASVVLDAAAELL